MSIETANLIASAVQIALMIVFGLWVKHFIDQQIKSKDAAIQALETTIKSKDSEISRIEKDSTPAVATAYQQVRDFAAAVAQDANELRTKLRAAESTPKLAQDRESLTRIAGRVEGIFCSPTHFVQVLVKCCRWNVPPLWHRSLLWLTAQPSR